MEQINEREIPNFFDMENNVKSDSKLDIPNLIRFLKEKGNIEDKIRLLCICVLCKDRDVLSQIENGFKEYMESLNGSDRTQAEDLMRAYHYLKSFRMTKNVSDRNLTARRERRLELIDRREFNSSIILQSYIRYH